MRPLLIEIEPEITNLSAGRRRAKQAGAELPQGGNHGQGTGFHAS